MTSIDDDEHKGDAGDKLKDRTFNHDLLISLADQTVARARWPHIAHVLINNELIEVFRPYEREAKSLKSRIQHVGSVSVLLMVFSLIASALLPWMSDERVHVLGLAAEISALAGLVCAALVSRFGPWRRSWMRNRFMTEVLRQWHFRRLLDGASVDDACAQTDDYLCKRSAALNSKLQEIRSEVGQIMDRLIARGTDALESIPTPQVPSDEEIRRQLLDAYRTLRLKHQLNFAAWKLSDGDKTFLGLSSNVLILVTDTLAGTTLVGALVLSVAHLMFEKLDWAPAAAVVLAILGVATRAWRDGLALGDDRERYEDMRDRLDVAAERWEDADTDKGRFRAAKEVEEVTLDELRGFLRSHVRAQFLF